MCIFLAIIFLIQKTKPPKPEKDTPTLVLLLKDLLRNCFSLMPGAANLAHL